MTIECKGVEFYTETGTAYFMNHQIPFYIGILLSYSIYFFAFIGLITTLYLFYKYSREMIMEKSQ